MKIDELIELIRAGYTKEEIQALTAPAADPEPEPEKKPEPEPAPKPEPETKPAEAGTGFQGMEKELKEIRSGIAEMIKTFQAANVQSARMNAPDNNNSAEDILANWLNPKSKGEN